MKPIPGETKTDYKVRLNSLYPAFCSNMVLYDHGWDEPVLLELTVDQREQVKEIIIDRGYEVELERVDRVKKRTFRMKQFEKQQRRRQ